MFSREINCLKFPASSKNTHCFAEVEHFPVFPMKDCEFLNNLQYCTIRDNRDLKQPEDRFVSIHSSQLGYCLIILQEMTHKCVLVSRHGLISQIKLQIEYMDAIFSPLLSLCTCSRQLEKKLVSDSSQLQDPLKILLDGELQLHKFQSNVITQFM